MNHWQGIFVCAGLAVAAGALAVVYAVTTNAAWMVVVGVIVGALIGIFSSIWLDGQRRLREIDDLKASLYVEVVEFVTRSLHDYLTYWHDFKVENVDSLTANRIHDFRPTRPIILPGIAGRLGLLADARRKPPVLPAVAKFYVRHDAVSQVIESTLFICERPEQNSGREFNKQDDQKRVDFIAGRLRSCFSPAADALDGLEGPGWLELDAETVAFIRSSMTASKRKISHSGKHCEGIESPLAAN